MTYHTPTALITGAGKRIGATIARTLHQHGYNVLIHYHHSHQQAKDLANTLNHLRPHSAYCLQADLDIIHKKPQLNEFVHQINHAYGRLDLLIHNASSFYPSCLEDEYDTLMAHWHDLTLTNIKAPFFLTHALLPLLKASTGQVISLLDIHADNKPFVGYPIYTISKAAHRAMVQALALELAPIRVNGIAPWVNIFPDQHALHTLDNTTMAALSRSIPLGNIGTPDDIAQAVLFLSQAAHITGQIIAIDGGRSLTLKGG